MSLDLSQKQFEHFLKKTSDLILQKHQNVDAIRGYNSPSQKEVAEWFEEPIPVEGSDIDSLLSVIKSKVFDTVTGNLGPHMYAYVMTGGNQVSILAEQLSAAINQNIGKWHLSPVMSEIEKRVIQWTKEILNLSGIGGGMFVSGGSEANLAGLTVARNIFFEQYDIRENGIYGMQACTIYASSEVHGCVDKSIEQLGLGTKHLRKIDVIEDFSINLDKLKEHIRDDIAEGYKPFCVIGNAGTVNTGAIDDFIALSKIAKEHNMWFHIDGAYGGLAGALPSVSELYQGAELADSFALDFHKWLYQPFDCGCLLVKDWDILKRTYFKKADYLNTTNEEDGRLNFNEHAFQLSRSTKGFKVWMTLKAYGFQAIADMIQKDIDLTKYLVELIKDSDDFRLIATGPLAIACFQYVGDMVDDDEIDQYNRLLIEKLEEDGRVFITGTIIRGVFCIRACLINHRKTKETTAYLLQVIREVAETHLFLIQVS